MFLLLYTFSSVRIIELSIYATIIILYSILPDIDIGNSKIGKSARVLLAAALLTTLALGMSISKIYLYIATILGIILFILLLVRHRGFIHTIRAGILFSAPLFFIGWSFFLAGLFSYCIHLLADRKCTF